MLVRRAFRPTHAGVRAARRFVRATLAECGLEHDPVVDLAQLATSELAANALRHARTGFELSLDVDGVVRIEIQDGSPDPPQLRVTGPFDEGGRGLVLVAAVADRWGSEPAEGGKRVWCELVVGGRGT